MRLTVRQSPATFSKTQYFLIIWFLFSIALTSFVLRILIRLKVLGHLMIDDGLMILAIICLLTSAVLNSMMVPTTFIVQDVRIHHAPKPVNYDRIEDSYAKYQWAVAYLFFTGIWAVKGSFLAFYDRLTQRLTFYRRAWWATIVITILTYIGSLFAYAFLDGINFRTNLKNDAIQYEFAADVTTDILITIIPLTLALKSRVPLKQKLALAGIFSLSLIVTIFSIVRFVLCRGTAGPSWLECWSSIEQSVSVTVASLVSFRTLMISKSHISERSSSRHRNEIINSSSGRKIRLPADKLGFLHLGPHKGNSTSHQRSEESMDIELLDPVHLRNPALESTGLS